MTNKVNFVHDNLRFFIIGLLSAICMSTTCDTDKPYSVYLINESEESIFVSIYNSYEDLDSPEKYAAHSTADYTVLPNGAVELYVYEPDNDYPGPEYIISVIKMSDVERCLRNSISIYTAIDTLIICNFESAKRNDFKIIYDGN